MGCLMLRPTIQNATKAGYVSEQIKLRLAPAFLQYSLSSAHRDDISDTAFYFTLTNQHTVNSKIEQLLTFVCNF